MAPWDSGLVLGWRGGRAAFQSVSLVPRRRMKITTANKAVRTPAIRRMVVESINETSPSQSLSANYMFSIIGSRSRTSRVMTGPMVTTNRVGSTQKKIGKTSFTANLAARSSALWRAMERR